MDRHSQLILYCFFVCDCTVHWYTSTNVQNSSAQHCSDFCISELRTSYPVGGYQSSGYRNFPLSRLMLEARENNYIFDNRIKKS